MEILKFSLVKPNIVKTSVTSTFVPVNRAGTGSPEQAGRERPGLRPACVRPVTGGRRAGYRAPCCLSVIAASAAMLAASALPAFATTHTSTHKLAFPSHSGISAWGNYKKTSKGIYVNVCAKDTKSAFAVAAVVVATNSSGSRSSNLGAVAMGHNQTQCRFGTIPYSSHLKTYVIGYTSHGTIAFKTSLKKIF